VISLESILKPRPYATIVREFENKARAIFAAKDCGKGKVTGAKWVARLPDGSEIDLPLPGKTMKHFSAIVGQRPDRGWR
jgi:hypothetical protein